jgi:hypothetical protein
MQRLSKVGSVDEMAGRVDGNMFAMMRTFGVG